MDRTVTTTLGNQEQAPKPATERKRRRLKVSLDFAIGLAFLIVVLVSAIAAPLIAPHDPVRQNYGALLQPPSSEHWFGTDHLGRDVASRVIHGSRIALTVGVAIVLIQMIIGVTLGLLSGYFRGFVDNILNAVTDVMLAIPTIVLVITVAGFLGSGVRNIIIALGVVGWRAFARIVRADTLAARERQYVDAALASGASNPRVMLRHILPNVAGSIIVYGSLATAMAILWAAALSFLGFGAQPPTPDWGYMVAEGRNYMRQAWWMTAFPGGAIMLTVLAFNLVGDGLRDLLDPNIK